MQSVYCIYILTTDIPTLYRFQIWFPFCHCLLLKLYVIIFCWLFKPRSVPFFFRHSFSVATVNSNNNREIQINESERLNLPLLFYCLIYTYFSTAQSTPTFLLLNLPLLFYCLIYPYFSTAIDKPFLVSIFLFCFLPIKS